MRKLAVINILLTILSVSCKSTAVSSPSELSVTAFNDKWINYGSFFSIEGDSGSVVYSPDGTCFAIAANSHAYEPSIRIFDAVSGELLCNTPRIGYQAQICYSPDGKYIASAGWSSRISIWNASSGELYMFMDYENRSDAHIESVRTVAYSPDGRFIASGSNDSTIKIWDTASWNVVYTLTEHKSPVNRVVFSPDGQYLLSASSDYTVKIWNVQDGKLLRTMKAKFPVNSAVYSPDGKYIAAGYDDYDNRIRIWDVVTGKVIHTIKSGRTWQVVFSPDGKLLAAAVTDSRSGSGGIKIFNTSTWDMIDMATDANAQTVAFSPDGEFLITSINGLTVIYKQK
jgi:WD40 repeat protein